jgi:CRP-like cAMP-binding protein
MLGALPAVTIEQLGAGLEHAEFAPRHAVFEQGEPGECFYVIESGRAEVVRDGRVVNMLGRGDCFGEIALLRDQPRTATVRASADGHLRVSVLQRGLYLTAVTGYPAAAAAGEDLATKRLKADAERLPTAGDAGSGPADRSASGSGPAQAPQSEHVWHAGAGDLDRPPESVQP